MTLARVAKRDGREVPFDEAKIRHAVERAMAAVGEEDLDLASEVAALVRLTLEDRYAVSGATPEQAVPHIEEIQDLVERALIELGRAAVAKAYIVYRDRRARIREALCVHEPRRVPGHAPTVNDAHGASRWSKGRIVAALMGEAEVTRDVAERVAASVEARVFALGQRSVSTALIRELVDGELFDLGLDVALRRQTLVGLPHYDLRQEIARRPPELDPTRAASEEALAERHLEARLAAELVRRHAQLEVLPEEDLERMRSGDFDLVGVSTLDRPLTCGLPLELLSARRDLDSSDAWALLDPLSAALSRVAFGLVLEDAAGALAGLASRARTDEPDPAQVAWLGALAALSQATGRRIDLAGLEGPQGPHGPGARRAPILARALRSLDAAPAHACLPRVFVEESALELALAGADESLALAIERLLAAGRLVPTWGSELERVVGPGLVRRGGERGAIACGAALALNLPRLALRAGPWREDRMLEGLAELVARGVRALGVLARAFERLRGRDALLSSLPRARLAHAVVPVGLRECLSWLGDGEVRPEQGARLLGFLSEHLEQLARSERLPLSVTPYFGERSAQRFARLDAQAPQRAQRLLFAEPTDAGAASAAYACGWGLSPAPGFAPWAAEAELLRTLSIGALHPLPQTRARGDLWSLRESWTRFARLRREPSAGVPHAVALARAGQIADLFPDDPIDNGAGAAHADAPNLQPFKPRTSSARGEPSRRAPTAAQSPSDA